MKHYTASKYRARSSIGYLIKRAHGLMMDRLEAVFAEHGFTFMQWVVLMYGRDELGFTSTDICRDYRHDSGALTRLIDQLEARDLIQRQRSTEDRRVVQLNLTEKGRETVESLIPLVADELNWALEDFSAAEVAELTRLMGKLLDRLQS